MVTILAGISLVVRIRESLQNAFIRPGNTPTPPAGKGDIIEGEFKVIDEREK